MHHFGSDKIRNVVLLSHSGAGKTSLAEAALFDTQATTRLGSVTDGTTVSDHDPEEIKRQISINLSLVPCQWKDVKINLIDTPGYPDFIAEVKEGVRVSEGAIIVVSAASGVEVGTEQAWEKVSNAGIPSLVFVNKMDRENTNHSDAIKNIQANISEKCIPIQLPIGAQKDFNGIVDLVSKKGYKGTPLAETDVPSDLSADIETYRDKLIEAVVEVDDELIMKYLDGEEVSNDDIYRCLKEATKIGKVVPILFGSSLNNVCITAVLDAIYDYLPSPAEVGTAKAINASGGAEEDIQPDANSPLAALIFKTSTDPRIGRISFLRVYSGTITSNSQVWNVNKSAVERVGQLMVLRGKTQEQANELSAGDIGAIAKLAQSVTGDTLGVREHQLQLGPIDFPEPVLNMAVHPKSRDDLDKMSTAIPKITDEDPTIKVHREPDVGEMLLCGMGETHLAVAAERMAQRFGVAVELAAPKVPYKETISVQTKADYKHKKQTGGHGQYGHVLIEMEPKARGEGYEFVNKIVGGAIPKNFIPAVEKGLNESLPEGVLAGYPVVDIKVTLYDGSYHPVDSSEMAFKIAAQQALKKGLSQGQSVLIEPIMNLKVVVPDTFTGDIIGDLNTKRARVMGMNPVSGMNIIEAQVPLAEIARYAIDLRSITQGRGAFTSEFNHYEEVPQIISQKIIEQKNTAAKTS